MQSLRIRCRSSKVSLEYFFLTYLVLKSQLLINRKEHIRVRYQKKPSSRFNEDAGFVAEPPKSTKKKGTPRGDTAEDTSKPFLLSDWSHAQIANYCEVCGIVFDDSVSDSIAHIRMLEKLRSASVRRPAETFIEVCET